MIAALPNRVSTVTGKCIVDNKNLKNFGLVTLLTLKYLLVQIALSEPWDEISCKGQQWSCS